MKNKNIMNWLIVGILLFVVFKLRAKAPVTVVPSPTAGGSTGGGTSAVTPSVGGGSDGVSSGKVDDKKKKVVVPPTLNPPGGDNGNGGGDGVIHTPPPVMVSPGFESSNSTALQPMVPKDRSYFDGYVGNSARTVFAYGDVIVSWVGDKDCVGYVFFNNNRNGTFNLTVKRRGETVVSVLPRMGVFCLGDGFTVIDRFEHSYFIKDKKFRYIPHRDGSADVPDYLWA